MPEVEEESSRLPEEPLCKRQVCRIETVIVGIRHYHGKYWLPDDIRLLRNPGNEFDCNAIQVRTGSHNFMIGHLRRELAKALAPMMDDSSIELVGIVSVTNPCEFHFTLPICVYVWTDVGDKDRIIAELQKHQHYPPSYKLTVLMPSVTIRKNAYFEAFKIFNMKEEEVTKHTPRDVTEKELSRVSQQIGKNFQLLGALLGLKNAEVEQVIMDNHTYGSKTIIFHMLLKWKLKFPGKATKIKLLKACKKTGDICIHSVRNCFKKST